ncbi:uncharacterized protein LOC116961007 [Tyto alba]|uniref:uncharacterized protein LOC116961007 n=1 Tax=Tyto alba TaxID=56313 RepID=UPI001C67A6D4|nr:uncharacterized protein LOC116961007 [Tyto alba]XP_032846043.2 uncharacterized protein LOC116961007 [Tyto alba]XP_032846044.2 uncharacterized protein LOC116961007 [Tyto alba]XP_032846045.2 uncharacterized protein LOC116961007 [Tyto alba]
MYTHYKFFCSDPHKLKTVRALAAQGGLMPARGKDQSLPICFWAGGGATARYPEKPSTPGWPSSSSPWGGLAEHPLGDPGWYLGREARSGGAAEMPPQLPLDPLVSSRRLSGHGAAQAQNFRAEEFELFGVGRVLPGLCAGDIQPVSQGMGGLGGALGALAEEEGNQAGERVPAQIRVVVIPASTRAGRRDAVGGRGRRVWGWRRRGGCSHGKICTQAVTQMYTDSHTEQVNRHMGRPCAASLLVVESKPGAKAHASRNTHTVTHTHSFPTGDLSSLAFISWSAQKEKPERGAGEVNDTER